jgi:hypothetical protein
MNKSLYKYSNTSVIFWYKTWENSSENSGASLDFEDVDFWTWGNWDDDTGRYFIGAACLAQW